MSKLSLDRPEIPGAIREPRTYLLPDEEISQDEFERINNRIKRRREYYLKTSLLNDSAFQLNKQIHDIQKLLDKIPF